MLVIFRLVGVIPAPGVDYAAVQASTSSIHILDLLNMMTGSNFANMTIMAMGITPYINSSIIMQLLTIAIPALERMQKSGPEGQKKIAQITRYVTVVLAVIQAIGLVSSLGYVKDGWFNHVLVGVTLAGGTAAKYFGGFSDQVGVTDTYGDSYGVWPLSDEITVWAKTGTAEHASGGSDHGAFVCFAAKNGQEPEVAIAIFGEKIAHGASLSPVAEDILQTYFAIVDAGDVTAFENQVS